MAPYLSNRFISLLDRIIGMNLLGINNDRHKMDFMIKHSRVMFIMI